MLHPDYKKRFFIPLALLSPPIIYGGLILIHGVNFPFLDDYDTVLAHLLHSGPGQVANWFSTHNEHNHLILRLMASIDMWTFGNLNLVRLMIAGAAFFFLFYFRLLKYARTWKLPFLWLVPVPFLLFQPSYWGSMTWATTALHNFPGILFALVALNLWGHPALIPKSIALLCLILALLTHGFGVAALIALLLWELGTLIRKRTKIGNTFSDPQWKSPGALLGVLFLWILLHNYQAVQSPAFRFSDLRVAVHFFSNFLGGCAHFLNTPGVTALAIVQLGAFAWLTRKGLARKRPELYWFIVYLFLCGIIATVGRVDLGAKQGLASRYRIISTLLVCSQYLGLAFVHWQSWQSRKWAFPVTATVAVVFFTASLLVNLNNLEKIQSRLLGDRQRWIRGEVPHEYPDPDRALLLLNRAEEAGFFRHRTPQAAKD